jgi:hypothetical protein
MRKKYKFSSFIASFIEIPEDDGIWSSGFFLLSFLLDFPAQEKQPIFVASLTAMGIITSQGEREGGGQNQTKQRLDERERVSVC